MKTIRIFLASSEELQDDRNAFGNLVRRLDKIYEKRGIRIELFEWEDYDAAYNGTRKQDEYNEAIKASDMFLALFHKKAGKYTLEEFDVATEEFRKNASPKVYTYCKDLQAGEEESPELAEFKKRLFEELGHYWCRYSNRDTMQLHFVMQLQLVDGVSSDSLKLEDGTVKVGDLPVAKLDNIPFAADNEGYRKIREELDALPEKIQKARQRYEKFPDDDDLKEDLQQKMDRYAELREEYSRLQEALFSTAKKIARMQLDRVSERMRQAIEAFEKGDLPRANAILEDIAIEADRHMEQLEENLSLIHKDIDAMSLQAETVIADTSVPLEERISRVKSIYEKADAWAQKSGYDKGDYCDLLNEYTFFLTKYAFYEEALDVSEREVAMTEELLGKNHPGNYACYYASGNLCTKLSDYATALDYYSKAFDCIALLDLDDEYSGCAITALTSMASALVTIGDYDEAERIIKTAFELTKKVRARDFNYYECFFTEATIHRARGHFQAALDSLARAAEYLERDEGKDTDSMSSIYLNEGSILMDMGEYERALEYMGMALAIYEKQLGPNHPVIGTVLSNIGLVYYGLGDYRMAEKNLQDALSILNISFTDNHAYVCNCKHLLANLYMSEGLYDKALEYCESAIASFENLVAENNPEVGDYINTKGLILQGQGKNQEALDCYKHAAQLRKEATGEDHPNVASIYMNIGSVYVSLMDYTNAEEYQSKALAIFRKVVGPDHLNTISAELNLAATYNMTARADEALPLLQDGLERYKKIYTKPHINISKCLREMGMAYDIKGDTESARACFDKAVDNLNNLEVPSPDSASVFHIKGQFHEKHQEYDLAKECYSMVREIAIDVLGEENNNDVAAALEGLGRCNVYLSRYDEAIEQLHHALEIRKIINGEGHILTSNTYSFLGWGYSRKGDYSTAIEYLRAAVAIFLQTQPADSPVLATLNSQIQYCEAQLGQSNSRKGGFLSKLLGRK